MLCLVFIFLVIIVSRLFLLWNFSVSRDNRFFNGGTDCYLCLYFLFSFSFILRLFRVLVDNVIDFDINLRVPRQFLAVYSIH